MSRTVRQPSSLEASFATAWRLAGYDPRLLRPEVKFAKGRKWSFDFAHWVARVAVEIEGGTHGWGKPCPVCKRRQMGRHSTGVGMAKDAEKYNAAAELGWVVFRFTTDMLQADPIGCAEQVMDTIKGKLVTDGQTTAH